METSLVAQASKGKSTAERSTRLFEDLVRCETRLYNGADAVLRPHGLVMSQLEFLRYVQDHPGTRAADLATTFAIGVGATSKGVARLEAKGWITRTSNPDDARSSLLHLTAEGNAVVDRAWASFTDFLVPLLDATLPTDAISLVETALERLRAHLEAVAVGMPAG